MEEAIENGVEFIVYTSGVRLILSVLRFNWRNEEALRGDMGTVLFIVCRIVQT
jgi:hypothetical protein